MDLVMTNPRLPKVSVYLSGDRKIEFQKMKSEDRSYFLQLWLKVLFFIFCNFDQKIKRFSIWWTWWKKDFRSPDLLKKRTFDQSCIKFRSPEKQDFRSSEIWPYDHFPFIWIPTATFIVIHLLSFIIRNTRETFFVHCFQRK